MRALRSWMKGRCSHRTTVSVRSAGIERVVCEACGHVSVHFLADMEGDVDRNRFARAVEREGAEASEGRHL